VGFVRTVLGDIDANELGVCYAHEHIVIDDNFATRQHPEFLLADVEKITEELTAFRAAVGRAMVDSMPGGCGRNAAKLADVSRRTGVHIVAPTGVHLSKYYPPEHRLQHMTEEELAEFFIGEIEVAMVDGQPTPYRAGVIKVAGGLDRLTDQQRRLFRAAAIAQRRTGAPILTHTEQGTAAMEQIDVLSSAGADLAHVVLSHLDRKPDLAYQREVLKTGVRIEYDSAFRWKTGNPTLDLLAALLPAFPQQILLGMDTARAAYWRSFGGSPGLTFLLSEFTTAMRGRGIEQDLIDRVFIQNPAEAYAFIER
jgi:predicted metal-dependent phosphotriesterase family hydrolase